MKDLKVMPEQSKFEWRKREIVMANNDNNVKSKRSQYEHHLYLATTNETDIQLAFNVDGTGISTLETDVPFLNHMLDLFTKHGKFDLNVEAKGDIDMDDHHTTEDIGICLGQTLLKALGDKRGIRRYASVFVPMDEALAQVIIDVSNRPHFEYRAEFPSQQVGSFDVRARA